MCATRIGPGRPRVPPEAPDSRISERTTEDSTGQVAWSMGAAHGIGKDEAGRFTKGRIRSVLGNGEPRKADDRAGPVATWAGEPGTGGAVVFRGAQTLSCTVIVCIEALANHGGRRMDGFGRMGRGRASLRRGVDL